VAGVLIMKNKFTLTKKFLEKTKHSFNPIFVKIAMENDSFDIVYLLKYIYPQSFTVHENTYFNSLLISFQRSFSCWLAKIHMMKSLMEHTSYYIKAQAFLLFMLQSIEKEEPANNPLYYAPNLLLLACNIVEICRLLTFKFAFLRAYTEKIEEIVVNVAAYYIEEMEDEDAIRAIVFEKDFEHRDSLTLLSLYDIVPIMNNKNMEKIALELWTLAYDVKGNLMTTSSALKIILYDSFNKPRDILADFFFLNWKYRTMDRYEHHLYQFAVWKKSMAAKYFVTGIFIFVL
jgi:hypothetical protein